MPEEKKVTNGSEQQTQPATSDEGTSGFTVVGGEQAAQPTSDPFDDLATDIQAIRSIARELLDLTASISKKVRDLQRAAKNREREFKTANELLSKLKKVSGF